MIRNLLILFLLFNFSYASEFKRFRTQKISPFSDTILAQKNKKSPPNKLLESFRKFNLNNSQNKSWKIRFNPMTNIPESIVGDRTKRYSGDAETIFLKFIEENRDLLKVDKENIRLKQKLSFAGVDHLNYQQYYKDLPVEFSYVKLHVNKNGEISGYQAKYYPDINIDINPSINSNFAEVIVKSELGFFNAQSKELVIYPDPVSEKYYLAWKIRGRGGVGEKAGLWVYYIDAISGKILFKYDDFRYACSPPYDKAYGNVTGYVYEISPIPTGNSEIHPDYWVKPVEKPLKNHYVWVRDYNNRFIVGDSNTGASTGEYCSNVTGKVFALLQGPYFSIVNFKNTSSYYTNANLDWRIASTSISSPNPYENNKEYVYNVTIPDTWSPTRGFAFVAPIFSSFRVGSMDNCGSSLDEDMLYLRDPSNNRLAAYVGNRSNFIGGYVPGPSYNILLKTDANGTFSGFNINISSYAVMEAPDTAINPTNIIWATWTYVRDGDGGEINAFYHLDKIRDYFEAMNKDPNSVNKPINLDKHVPVMVHAFGDKIVPGYCGDYNSMYNAFYDLEKDIIMLGDGPMDLNNRYRDFALDGTIVRHEYTHLVINRIYPIINFGEFGAISEAMADYFSLSSFWKDNIDIALLGNFIGAGEAVTRDLSQCVSGTPCVMPADWRGEVHDDSLILSRALYKLRKNPTYQLGSFNSGVFNGLNKADVFTFAALFYFPDNFSNFLDAYIDACKQLDINCNSSVQNKIISAFSAHGITSSGYASNDIYEPNNGPEWATDISSMTSVTAYIDYPGDEDYYSLPLSAGPAYFRLDLPLVNSEYGTYNAFSLLLFDQNRKYLADVTPEVYNTGTGYCPSSGQCLTLSPYVELYYNIPKAGRYYLAVVAGPSEGGGNAPDYNSNTPYKLSYTGSVKGSMSANISNPSFDNDEISFNVRYPVFAYQVHPASSSWNWPPWTSSEVKFEYARLLDHNLIPIPETETNSVGYMELINGSLYTTTNSIGDSIIAGKVRIKPGFSKRYPGIGTVYLEIMGSNHMFNIGKSSNVFSLGISNPINLTTNKNDFITFNNIITKNGEKTILKYDIENPGHLSIKVYTISGSLVKTIYNDYAPAGKGTFEWDGTNESGSKVASGIYYIKVKGPGLDKVDKVAVVR